MRRNALSFVYRELMVKYTSLLRLSPSGWQSLQVAAAGYAIVGLFGATYGVTALLWPRQSTLTYAVIAALVAAPAALSLIWPRLTAVKAFGLEVSLAAARADAVEPGLVEAWIAQITPPAFDIARLELELKADEASIGESAATEHPLGLLEQLRTAGMERPLELLEQLRTAGMERLFLVDLGAGDLWLSTRLYLLAALADDFLHVPRFVFTARYPHDSFVGMAGPPELKTALGLALPPAVDEAYVQARREATDAALGDRLPHIGARFAELVAGLERPDGRTTRPSGVPWVTGDRLYEWLTAAGKTFDTSAIITTGLTDAQLVLAVALESRDRYVTLVAATRQLQMVVDRLDILRQAAAARRTAVGLRAEAQPGYPSQGR